MQGYDIIGHFFWKFFYLRRNLNIFLFNNFIKTWLRVKGISIKDRVRFNGLPITRRFPGSQIIFKEGCKINSGKNSTEVRLISPSTFITLKKDAIIEVGKNSGLSGALIVAAGKVKIGENVLIGAHCKIIDNDFHNSDPDIRDVHDNIVHRPVIIEDNVFLGFNCTILKGVTIGRNSVIGADSLVIQNIPENSIALGNPCKVIIKKNWK